MYKNKNWLEQQIGLYGSIKKISKSTGYAETTLKRWCDKFDLKPINTRQSTDRVTKEFLIEQYSLGKEIREISKQFGLSTATIVNKNKEYSISALDYNPKYKYNDVKWLSEQFELYGSVSKVAEQTGYPRTNISRAAVRFNIYEKIYTRDKSNPIDESYFDVIDDPCKAYYLGLIMADGNIYEYDDGRLQFSLKLKSTDHSIIDTFSECIGFPKDKIRYGHLMRKDTMTHYVEIRSYNTTFCNNLIKHGIVKAKGGTEHMPNSIPSEYIRDFIRGYIDGDGWVLNNNLGVCSTSAQIITDIRDFCGNYINITTSINEYNGLYRYQINRKNDIATICKVLYYPGCVALERKYKQAKNFIQSI